MSVSLVFASINLPNIQSTSLSDISRCPSHASLGKANHVRRRLSLSRRVPIAMAIPGYGVVEQVFVGGFSNFLQIYNLVITGRILLSWIPQSQSVGLLQPVFQITDPYLNLFRGIIPPIGGLDLSPLLAFVTLNLLTSATAAVGHEIPDEMKKKLKMKKQEYGRTSTFGFRL